VPPIEDPPARPAPPEDPVRRIAVVSAAVLVPVVAVAVVATNLLGGSDRVDDPAGVASAPAPQRADLPVLPLEVPPVTPEADASCPAVMSALPLDLVGEPSRRVRSESPYAYAWGDPPVSLVCGVDRPDGFGPSSPLYQINGVLWFVDDSAADTTVWTAVDRPVYVELQVPASIDSGPATVLSTAIAEALPFQEPAPGP
jgi:hypothetical protein